MNVCPEYLIHLWSQSWVIKLSSQPKPKVVKAMKIFDSAMVSVRLFNILGPSISSTLTHGMIRTAASCSLHSNRGSGNRNLWHVVRGYQGFAPFIRIRSTWLTLIQWHSWWTSPSETTLISIFCLIRAHLSYNANRYVRPRDAQREEVAGGVDWQHALGRVFFPFLFAHKAGECKQVNKSKDILNSL